MIHFQSPKVQASITANTYVVSGSSQTKKLEEMLPDIITQMGHENIVNLQKMAAQFSQGGQGQGEGQLPKVDTHSIAAFLSLFFSVFQLGWRWCWCCACAGC